MLFHYFFENEIADTQSRMWLGSLLAPESVSTSAGVERSAGCEHSPFESRKLEAMCMKKNPFGGNKELVVEACHGFKGT